MSKRQQPERSAKAAKPVETKPSKKASKKAEKNEKKAEPVEAPKKLSEEIKPVVPLKKAKVENSALDQLKTLTKVVADTGNFSAIEKYKPEDATTNPSLVLQTAKLPLSEAVILSAIKVFYRNSNFLES